jgi:hypothetical protein
MRIATLITLIAGAALADTTFTVRQMTREDVPLGQGQCDIRLQIDGEAEVSLEGGTVHIRTISGRDGYDDGSVCNLPVPRGRLEDFQFEVREKRNEIQLLAEPSARSGFRTVVAIRDSSGGQGRYHFRVSWARTGGGGGFVRTPRQDFGGRGLEVESRGSGSFRQQLTRASVRVSENGQVSASFDGRLQFNGRVRRNDGGTMVAEVRGQDGAPAEMVMVLDGRGEIRSMTVNGSGFSLEWRR